MHGNGVCKLHWMAVPERGNMRNLWYGRSTPVIPRSEGRHRVMRVRSLGSDVRAYAVPSLC